MKCRQLRSLRQYPAIVTRSRKATKRTDKAVGLPKLSYNEAIRAELARTYRKPGVRV